MLQLQLGQDSVCVPESWTDHGMPAEDPTAQVPVPILSPEALRELLDLVATLLPSGESKTK